MTLTTNLVLLALLATTAVAEERNVGISPWGPQD